MSLEHFYMFINIRIWCFCTSKCFVIVTVVVNLETTAETLGVMRERTH